MPSLDQLLKAYKTAAPTSVTSDSRAVKPGTAFVAVKGGTQDGHQFIAQAAQDGACLIVGEESPAGKAWATSVGPTPGKPAYVQVPDSREALAYLAATHAGHPSHHLKMIGVTGTSGKTTTTYILESILKAAGHHTGVIGTVNFRFGDKIYPSTHTTPGPVELQQLLKQMREDGCTAVVMEVSSHALKQHRSAFIAFDGMIFNNLTPEHLDFHPDMEDYFNAKAMLFTTQVDQSLKAGKKPVAAINSDDEYGQRLLRELKANAKPGFDVRAFGLHSFSGEAKPELKIDLSGIHGKAGNINVDSALTGQFNAQNILAALTVAQGLKIPAEQIAQGIKNLPVVPGRLERVPNTHGIHVLVDYAHKPDALEKVLKTLREVRSGHRLITVFGCGGDRDRTKRPVMGRLAVELSDHVWVTSDNPRTEDPASIIREVLSGMQGKTPQVEPDRAKAIEGAIRMAKPGDLVLIAGKGHEDYQIIADPTQPGGTRKIHFDDREVAAQVLKTR